MAFHSLAVADAVKYPLSTLGIDHIEMLHSGGKSFGTPASVQVDQPKQISIATRAD
jgi:hypothetical protein